MLRLGTKVRVDGQEAVVVARTLAGAPKYDVRLADGRLIKYASESDLEVLEESAVVPPTLGRRGRGGSIDSPGRA